MKKFDEDEEVYEEEVYEEEVDVPISEAIKALETLSYLRYKQEDGSEVLLRVLDQADRRYLAKRYMEEAQTIDISDQPDQRTRNKTSDPSSCCISNNLRVSNALK